MHPSEARIDLDALRANADLATRLAGSREVIAVVKADAYGHGAIPVARALVDAGCRRLAVHTVQEGVVLRDAGITVPVLVLAGARDASEAARAVARDLTAAIHHRESLDLVVSAARAARASGAANSRTRVHVEVDTGMHRMGVAASAAAELLREAAGCDALEVEGVFTHFACADEPDLGPSLAQIARFRDVLSQARSLGVAPPLVHAANSAALMVGAPLADALPEATAVRPGLMLYGVRPAPHLAGALQPVMTLRATVLAVRSVAAGDTVGYGGAFTAPAGGTRVATLSVGYADGIPRSAGGRGHVFLAGGRRAIVGRVSMDSIAVDVGTAHVKVGDEAVVFGRCRVGARGDDGADDAGGPGDAAGISVEDAATAAGTLAYELLVRVGSRVPRTLVGGACRA